MERKHIYKFLFQLGIILLIGAIGILCMTLGIDDNVTSLMQITFFGIYLIILIPMFLISLLLIIISKIKLKTLKKQNKDLSDENV